MTRTKVFVGNLSFKTNDRDLTKEFEAAGKVASASIISRGSRSLGYGFVEMESEEEAKKSVELLNKKLIDGREINVEIARPREEKPPQDPNAPQQAGGSPSGEGGRGGGAGRGRRPFRGGRRFRRGGPRNQEGRSPNGGDGGNNNGGPQNNNNNNNNNQQNNNAGGAPGGAPRRPRAPRPPRNDSERGPRTPSVDTLFVANLPFSVDDAGLAKIFEGMNIKAAHVVRKHNERSKGFGFVEFHSADDQQKALNAVDKKNVDNRELSVKIALTEVARNGASPAAAPVAPGSPAPAAPTTAQ